MIRPALFRSAFFLAVWGPGGAAIAQDKAANDDTLSTLRERLQPQLTEAERAPLQRWIAALTTLEQRRTANGDEAGASLARAKITELQARLGGDSPAGSAIALLPADARAGSGADFSGSGRDVIRISRAGATLDWEPKSLKIPAGTYEVCLTYGVAGAVKEYIAPGQNLLPGNTGGIVEFRNLARLGSSEQLLTANVYPTGGWETYRTLNMGQIAIDGRIPHFSLRCQTAGKEGLMNLRRVEFVPVASRGPGQNSAEEAAEFARLAKVYDQTYTQQTKSLTDQYLKRLATLEAELTTAQDTDGIARVRQERDLLKTGTPATALARAVELRGSDTLLVTLRGESRLTNQRDYITRIRPVGCEITWNLEKAGVPAGIYEVGLKYRLTNGGGGQATLSASGGGTPVKLNFDNKWTPPMAEGATRIEIGRGSQYLSLKVTSLTDNSESLCDLAAIVLTPVTK